ncbi:hypothetical protein GIB67_017387, partial [Kingdonia uniflora]
AIQTRTKNSNLNQLLTHKPKSRFEELVRFKIESFDERLKQGVARIEARHSESEKSIARSFIRRKVTMGCAYRVCK